ncbi:MAG TPA: RNA-binding protein [Patescibacteria group bacterium]
MQDDAAQTNPKKLFVGNLPWSVGEDQLRDLFAEFGDLVDVKLVIDRMSGRSRGIGFVEYATEEEAQAAIDAMNGKEVDGRALNVNVARPPRPREDRGGFRSHGGGYNNRGGDRGGYRGGNDRGGYRD